jgi:hypothetical protein
MTTFMKRVFTSPDTAELGLLMIMLLKAGLRCVELNEQMARTIPSAPFQAELWLRTRPIIRPQWPSWKSGGIRQTQRDRPEPVLAAVKSWEASSASAGNVAPSGMSRVKQASGGRAFVSVGRRRQSEP